MLDLSLNWIDYVSLFLIIFVGIPHGALDGAISITLGYSKRLMLQLGFFGAYLLAVSYTHLTLPTILLV